MMFAALLLFALTGIPLTGAGEVPMLGVAVAINLAWVGFRALDAPRR
jgi:hypothetical protein